MLNFRSVIEIAPLQVYFSALLFSPNGSIVKKQFWNQPPWIERAPTASKGWGASLQVLDCHPYQVLAVVFSPDGKYLVSATPEGEIRLWDPKTGALQETVEGYSGDEMITAIAFSPDCKLFALGSGSNVQIRDLTTGSLRKTLKGHSSNVSAVAFSPDSKLLASSSWDSTIRLWDPKTGYLRETLKGHSD
jgi:WD40 repeat protein